jgi:hypothetical protein
MNRRRVGEDRGSKETDGCPLTHPWVRVDVIGLSYQSSWTNPNPV